MQCGDVQLLGHSGHHIYSFMQGLWKGCLILVSRIFGLYFILERQSKNAYIHISQSVVDLHPSSLSVYVFLVDRLKVSCLLFST